MRSRLTVLAAMWAIAGAAWANDASQAADPVQRLETAYGPASQQGFGSAVFREALSPESALAAAALTQYRYFVGAKWDRFGEQAWLAPWREVHSRPANALRDIVAELNSIKDPDARRSTPLLLEATDEPASAQSALAAAFDDASVTELRVFNVGDGEAMSGLLVAARRAKTGDAIYLIVLMD